MKYKKLMPAVLLVIGITVQAQEVTVVWQDDAATVTVSDDIRSLVKAKVSGADVSVEQDAYVAQEITYHLSGRSDNGSFIQKGDFKITLSLEGLTLTSRTGAAMQIKNGKRIAVVLKDGTENTLTDADGGAQKACMIVKGHSEFQGGGSLTVNGRGKHAYKGDEYVELKASSGTLTFNSTVKDGIHTDDYFEMKGGTLNITTTGGGYWDDEDLETKTPSCINTASYAVIRDGTLNLLSTGDGGKGIKCDSTFTMTGGTLTARTTGARYIYEQYEGDRTDIDNIPDSLKNSPKAVKADRGILISGGTLRLSTEQDGGEGLESKDTLTVTGGDIRIEAYDDCINAAGDVRISGGDLFLNSLDNDGLDTNQSMYISGGSIVTQGNWQHELGIDVNVRSPKKGLYVTGGGIVCLSGASQIAYPDICDASQPALYCKGKFDTGAALLLRCTDDGQDILRYRLLRDYTADAGGTQPDLCIMFSSPRLEAGKGYELTDENTGRVIARCQQLSELYSRMEAVKDSSLSDHFDRGSFTLGSVTLPYRKAAIAPEAAAKPALVLYLHGGTARGSDNEAQLQEKAVGVIWSYLTEWNIPAVFIVPQCPAGGGWTSQNRKVVNELLNSIVKTGTADADRIYVMGGSMGGTGTWCQLSYFPGFYAAAMPVAGNPTGMNAVNVATTPVLTVMGTADNMMSIPAVESFMSEVIAAGGTVRLDTGEGWSHTVTCEESYTAERLDWLFAQSRNSAQSIRNLMLPGDEGDSVCYDLFGRRVSRPSDGLYILNGKKVLLNP